jgi:thiol:disulfide interchange protein DsbD
MIPWMVCKAGGPGESRTDLRSLLQKGSSSNSQDFLPPDEAFQFAAALAPNGSVKLEWVIAPGYYLYKDRLHVDSPKDVQLGAPQLPRGQLKHDENFGDTEVYYEIMETQLAVKQRGAAKDLNFKVTYQGCAEAGLCYNPIVKQVTLPLPPTGDSAKQIGDTQRPSSQPASGGGEKSRP